MFLIGINIFILISEILNEKSKKKNIKFKEK